MRVLKFRSKDMGARIFNTHECIGQFDRIHFNTIDCSHPNFLSTAMCCFQKYMVHITQLSRSYNSTSHTNMVPNI